MIPNGCRAAGTLRRRAVTSHTLRECGPKGLVIDGTLIPIDRVAADRPLHSGKHNRHGMNLQVIAGPDADIGWVPGAASWCRPRRDAQPVTEHIVYPPPAMSSLCGERGVRWPRQIGHRRAGVLVDRRAKWRDDAPNLSNTRSHPPK